MYGSEEVQKYGSEFDQDHGSEYDQKVWVGKFSLVEQGGLPPISKCLDPGDRKVPMCEHIEGSIKRPHRGSEWGMYQT